MQNIKVRALRSFAYAGKRRRAGDEFEVRSSGDARVLRAVGHVGDPLPVRPEPVRAPVRQVRAVQPLQRVLAADAEPLPVNQNAPAGAPEFEPDAGDEPVKPKRTYKRRDLVSE